MKIKNLLLVPLLSAALVATSACNSDNGQSSDSTSTSQVEGKVVARITVKKVDSVVVGSEIDFDELVTVYYDDESTDKNYTIEVPAASKNLVKVTDHKVKFLKEGNPSVTVKSGEQSAKFTTLVLSKLKKEAHEKFSKISDNFALISEGKPLTIHKPNYSFVNANYGEDPWTVYKNTTDGHGYLKFDSGTAFSYELNDGTVKLGKSKISSYDNYFLNMPFEVMTLEATTENDGDGDYLYFGPEVASSMSEYFYNFTAQFVWLSLNLDFDEPSTEEVTDPETGEKVEVITKDYTRWYDMSIKPVELDGFEETHYQFDIYSMIYDKNTQAPKKGKSPKLEFSLTLMYAEDNVEQAAVKAFRDDPDNEPESYDFTAAKNAIYEKLDGADHNYTLTSTASFFRGSKTSPINDNVFTETHKYNEHAVEMLVDGQQVGEYGQYWAAAYDNELSGFVEHEDKLYSWEVNEQAEKVATENTQAAGKGIYEYYITPAWLHDDDLYADIYVSEFSPVNVEESKFTAEYTIDCSDSYLFVAYALRLSISGRYYMQNLLNYWPISETDPTATDWRDILGSTQSSFVLTLGYDNTGTSVTSITMDFTGIIANFTDIGGYVYYKAHNVISSFGETAVDTSGIIYPEAA